MKVCVTGNKAKGKIYHHHTGYIGNLKSIPLGDLMDKHPTRAIESAVKGMLPKNKLGRATLGKLRVYAGTEHPHQAQNPQTFALTQRRSED